VAALYTEDAVQVTPQGPVFGRQAIEKLFAGVFQQGHYSNHLNKDDPGSPHMLGTVGNEVWREVLTIHGVRRNTGLRVA
jgi:hypothetical protein